MSTITATTTGATANAEIGAAEGIETLYTHPAARVIKFAASSRRLSGSVLRDQQVAGTLPWTSPTEQTLANGPLEIYRVPGSVSFIHSGSLLHAIMPRSQCWCVDGKSKFAMRVALPDTYYRIELPGETPEDMDKVAEFEVTLRKVLFYERTECPFARGFVVDLPEQPEIKKRRRRNEYAPAKKWRLHRAYSWKPEDGEESPRPGGENYGSDMESDEDTTENYESSMDEGHSDASGLADEVKEVTISTPSRPSVRDRVAGLAARQALASPPEFPLQPTPPSRLRYNITTSDKAESETATTGPAAEASDLRTLQSIPTAMPPSPPDSSAGYGPAESGLPHDEVQGLQQPSFPDVPDMVRAIDSDTAVPNVDATEDTTIIRNLSETDPFQMAVPNVDLSAVEMEASPDVYSSTPILVTANGLVNEPEVFNSVQHIEAEEECRHLEASALPRDSPGDSIHVEDGSLEHDAASQNSNPEDPFIQIQRRIQARRSIGGQRSDVPVRYPSSSSSGTSVASRRSRPTQQQQAFATALASKAVNTFLGPPAVLVTIMLRIASRFASSALAVDFGFDRTPDHLQRVPGSFMLDDELDDLAAEEWEEDDFGVPIRSPIRAATVSDFRAREPQLQDRKD